MKRLSSILYLAIVAVFMATLVSCEKEQSAAEREETVQNGKLSVSMLGIAGEYEQSNDVKSELVANIRVNWKINDIVYVFDKENCLGTLYVEDVYDNGKTAKLKGSVNPTVSSKVTLVHTNAPTFAPTIDGSGNIKIDLSTQSSTKGTPKETPFVAYGTIDASQLGNSISVNFSLASSVMRLNCSNLYSEATIKRALLTGMGNKVVIKVSENGAATVDGEAGDIALSFSGLKANDKGAKTIYAAVAKTTNEVDLVLSLTTTTSATQKYEPVGEIPAEILSKIEETRDYVLGKANINPGQSVNVICLMSDHPYTMIAGKKWSTRFMTTIDNGTEYINYYYWAGMRPVILKNGENAYWADTKEAFDGYAARDKGYRPYYNVSNSGYTKYLDENHYNLEDMDDVAVQKWGEGWRMPTSFEVRDMAKQTVWVYNGGYAYIFAAEEGDGAYNRNEKEFGPEFCQLASYRWPDTANWEKYKDKTPLLVLPTSGYIYWNNTAPTELSYAMYAWTRSLSYDMDATDYQWKIWESSSSFEFHVGTNITYTVLARGLQCNNSKRHFLFPVLPMHD